MSTDRDGPIRVGVRIVVVAAAVGFLVLALNGRARASEEPPTQQWEDALLVRDPLSADERVERAEESLHSDRWRRLEQIHDRVLEAGWRLWQNASPTRVWSGTRRVARAVWNFGDRGSDEDVALDWIEPGLPESSDPALRDLYERLRGRERQELAQARLSAAQAALDEGRLEVARVLLKRALVLQPDSEVALNRFAELQKREHAAHKAESELSFHTWEVPLSEALLAGDYDTALQMGPAAPETEFAHAAAQLLGGEREAALKTFADLEKQGGPLGQMAGRWLERPEVDVDGELARAVRQYRWKRVLGWIGGNALADRGAALTKTSLRAWKDSLTPTNIGLSLPARVIRGWKPDGADVREAAHNYLDFKPHGSEADAARQWLDHVGWPKIDQNSFTGAFQLPAAQTPYAHLGVAPVIVSRRAIDSEFVSGSAVLRSALEGVGAVWIEARKPDSLDLDGEGLKLEPREARRLIDELAFAVEQTHFRSSLASRDASLERLRRLDSAVASGWVLFAEPWAPRGSGLWSSVVSTVVDGTEHTGAVSLARGQDDIVAAHTIGDGIRECPRDTLCLDRDGGMRTTFYGYLDMQSSLGVGFQSTAGQAGLSLGLNASGPEASLILPLGRWLGINNWLPVEAEFTVGAESFYVGPVLRKRQCAEEPDPDQSSARQVLPLGLRSRCVIRFY